MRVLSMLWSWLDRWQERRRLRRFARDLDGWIAEMGIEGHDCADARREVL